MRWHDLVIPVLRNWGKVGGGLGLSYNYGLIDIILFSNNKLKFERQNLRLLFGFRMEVHACMHACMRKLFFMSMLILHMLRGKEEKKLLNANGDL